jgi:tRNA-specific 2-thiouridylase
LDIALGKPAFVTAIDPDSNTIVLGEEEDLKGSEIESSKTELDQYDGLPEGMEVLTKIRYKTKCDQQCLHSTKTA